MKALPRHTPGQHGIGQRAGPPSGARHAGLFGEFKLTADFAPGDGHHQRHAATTAASVAGEQG